MKYKPTDKTPKPQTPRGKYEEKLVVKGSFLDIIQASVKNANEKAAEKNKNEETKSYFLKFPAFLSVQCE